MATILRTSVDYTNFGPLGPAFQAQYEQVWEQASAMWAAPGTPRLVPVEASPFPPHDEAMNTLFDRGGFLAKFLFAAATKRRRVNECVALWKKLRNAFKPPLPDGLALMEDRRNYGLREALQICHSSAVLANFSDALNLACFGPYTEGELEYIRVHHPKTVEAGAGSGYLLHELRMRGVDAVGFDSNLYGLVQDGGPQPEWTRRSIEGGHLTLQHCIPDESFFTGRTMIISWPMPGASLPFEVLPIFARAGGRKLLLKIGGYVMPREEAQMANIFRFFEMVARHWREDNSPDAPRHNPWMMENNLLSFVAK